MNPRLLEPYLEADRQRQLSDDFDRWMLGLYVVEAVRNALDGKHSKYPQKPFLQEYEDKRVIDGSDLSEEEQEIERMKIMRQMGYVADERTGNSN